MPEPLLDATPSDLARWMTDAGFPRFHADQIFRWIFDRRATHITEMSDLPKRLRESFAETWSLFSTSVVLHDLSPDGTDKLLLECRDGRRVECVLMSEGPRRTVCVSTQVGCAMGCVFCASGLKGVERNLTKGEIVEQVVRLRNLLPAGERLTNLVVMGMGESLANLDNLVAALDWISSPQGLGLGQRRITISTVGLPKKMRELAELDRQYHLAVSLHAPTEDLRNQLVPINERVGLADVIEAADAYFQKTGRRVTYEYVLLKGVNDRPEDATALGALLRGRNALVNLIPYNPVEGLPFGRPTELAIRRFREITEGFGVSVSIRKTKGRTIDAACGQLRRRAQAEGPTSLATLAATE